MSRTSEVEIKKKESRIIRSLKLVLKIVITILCFWYISTKINFSEALKALLKANWFLLFVALLFFILSKILSAFRLNIYFRNIRLQLSEWKNIKLYWLGMFYNLFLPGAISGDAYKVVLLNRKYKTSYKKASAAVLLDRFSGVLALGIILSVYGVIVLHNYQYDVLLIFAAILAFAGFYFVIRFLFKDFLQSFFPTFLWALAVQVSQVVCVYFIMLSLHLPLSQHEWVFIFLLAAVISVLPISLGGGLGTREVVFAGGANFFHLDPQTGVIISLLFYLLTVIGSAWGLYYNFHDPLKDTVDTSNSTGNHTN
ncbi:MAG TPA: lysylphosphatidylglycerol synthase transmembrane domain-containing protein [Flavisolibacter sp.]|nr:lysylphosphatidylglycerol synthase transmembrane domain-containing protein [Flavisolibacter sp.]